MFAILLFSIIGFLIGLGYVIIKRKVRPGNILTAVFLGLLSVSAWKAIKDYFKTKGKDWHF